MKFQDSSFNGLKVTVGTKSVTHPGTHPPTHALKAICPINIFKVGGIIRCLLLPTFRSLAAVFSEKSTVFTFSHRNAYVIKFDLGVN